MRAFLTYLVLAVLASLPDATWPADRPAREVSRAAPQRLADLTLVAPLRLADGIWLFRGQPGPPGPGNLARTGNVVALIGTRGVLVWNSGASDRHGQALVAAIGQLTRLPLRAVILAEPAQDLVFGTTAFARQGAAVLMAADAIPTLRQRCGNCLLGLQRDLGEREMAGTRLPEPDPLDAQRRNALGAAVGRRLRWLDLGQAAIGGTTAVLDLDSGILLAGPMVMVKRVGDVRDADLECWRQGLDRLAALAPRLVIPDRGEPGTAQDLDATRAYLDALDARTAALLADDVTLGDAPGRAALPAFSSWLHHDDTHRRNVHFRYLQLERKQFQEP